MDKTTRMLEQMFQCLIRIEQNLRSRANDSDSKVSDVDGKTADVKNTVDLQLGITEHNEKDRKLIAEQSARLNQITLGNLELSDEQKLEVADLFPLWETQRAYKAKDVVKWGWNEDGESKLWEVLQEHTSQEDWTPDKAPSLFKQIGFTPSGYPVWVQPLGATDAYQTGDIVSYNDKLYQSTVDNNVWSPEAYPQGWQEYSE